MLPSLYTRTIFYTLRIRNVQLLLSMQHVITLGIVIHKNNVTCVCMTLTSLNSTDPSLQASGRLVQNFRVSFKINLLITRTQMYILYIYIYIYIYIQFGCRRLLDKSANDPRWGMVKRKAGTCRYFCILYIYIYYIYISVYIRVQIQKIL